MDISNVGLIVEGGGLRAMFASGVLDHFLTEELHFPYVVGVSAGALYSASYVSKQYQRNLNIQLRYLTDPRYMGFKYLLTTGNYINLDFTFHEIAKQLAPYDFDYFFNMKTVFEMGAFNCVTGKTDYFSSAEMQNEDEFLAGLVATSSLPFISQPVAIDEQVYLDGGICDAIPAERAFSLGYERLVIILSQDASYRKSVMKMDLACRIACYKHPKVYQALRQRHENYNRSLVQIDLWEKEGKVFVIRPDKPVTISRLEKDLVKVQQCYDNGTQAAKTHWQSLQTWLNKPVERESEKISKPKLA